MAISYEEFIIMDKAHSDKEKVKLLQDYVKKQRQEAQKELLDELESKMKIKLDSKKYPQSLNEWDLENILREFKSNWK